MLKLGKIIREKMCKIIREKMCKIIREFNIYNIEQVFDKNTNFKIALGGVHSFNALIYNRASNCIRRYNNVSTGVL